MTFSYRYNEDYNYGTFFYYLNKSTPGFDVFYNKKTPLPPSIPQQDFREYVRIESGIDSNFWAEWNYAIKTGNVKCNTPDGNPVLDVQDDWCPNKSQFSQKIYEAIQNQCTFNYAFINFYDSAIHSFHVESDNQGFINLSQDKACRGQMYTIWFVLT